MPRFGVGAGPFYASTRVGCGGWLSGAFVVLLVIGLVVVYWYIAVPVMAAAIAWVTFLVYRDRRAKRLAQLGDETEN